jgi:hypothetical protein
MMPKYERPLGVERRRSPAMIGERAAAPTRQRVRGGSCEIHHETLPAQVPPELLAEKRLDIGFVINHKNQNAHV